MELQRLTIFLAILMFAVISQCSEAHSLHRRASDYTDYENEVVDEDEDQHATIVSKPEDFTVSVGSRVALECQITPPASAANKVVSWTKNEDHCLFLNRTPFSQHREKYELDNGNRLIINDLNLNDTGRYTCKILQAVVVSVTHTVSVAVPPVITSFTVSDNEPVEGAAVAFICQASGVPKPLILWSRVTTGEKSAETWTEANAELNNHTFYIPNVSKNDSGEYHCSAVNDAGIATSQTVTLKVLGKPFVHALMPVVYSDINEKAELKCSTLDGYEISWFKNGRRIQTGANFVVNQPKYTSESTLTVTPKSSEDFGAFRCEASNRAGVHSRTIELRRREASVSSSSPSTTTTDEA
ncbi:hypothetical protein O0L34_g13406 [Tuta absoluta]|nr:hypothetical protein O0L34_g13406 [Tuta absoluta]